MISDGRADIAAAVAVALGETAHVYDHVPDAAAAPCAWIEPVAGAYTTNMGAQTSWDVTVVADAGLGARDAALALDAMTDAVLAMICPGVEPRSTTWRGGGLTTRIGETPHPCTVLTVPQIDQTC